MYGNLFIYLFHWLRLKILESSQVTTLFSQPKSYSSPKLSGMTLKIFFDHCSSPRLLCSSLKLSCLIHCYSLLTALSASMWPCRKSTVYTVDRVISLQVMQILFHLSKLYNASFTTYNKHKSLKLIRSPLESSFPYISKSFACEFPILPLAKPIWLLAVS